MTELMIERVARVMCRAAKQDPEELLPRIDTPVADRPPVDGMMPDQGWLTGYYRWRQYADAARELIVELQEEFRGDNTFVLPVRVPIVMTSRRRGLPS